MKDSSNLDRGRPRHRARAITSWTMRWLGGVCALVGLVGLVVSGRSMVGRPVGMWYVEVAHGGLQLNLMPERTAQAERSRSAATRIDFIWVLDFYLMAWPRYEFERNKAGELVGEIEIPLWMPVGAMAVSTVVAWRMRSRRIRAGRCLSCGYDLHGLPELSPCPECGNLFGRPTAPAQEV